MALPSLKRPGFAEKREGITFEPVKEKPITEPEKPQGVPSIPVGVPMLKTAGKIVKGIGEFGKGVGQAIARSFLATGAEITERLITPKEERRPFGKATYTPQGETEQKIFGTKEPVSFETIGEEMLAIGGRDFQEKWGKAAIPLGVVIAGLDITPIGWGKRKSVEKIARTIAKTDNTALITKTLKPLFKKGVPHKSIEFLSRSLRKVNKEDDVINIIRQAGNLNIPKKGYVGVREAKPSIKPESDAHLYQLYDMHKAISAPPKLSAEEAARLGIARRVTKGGKVVPAIRKSGVAVPEEFAQYPHFKDVRAGWLGGSKDPTRAIQEIDGALSLAKKAKLPGQVGAAEKFVLWRTRDMAKTRAGWLASRTDELKNIAKGISNKQARIANEVLEKVSRKGAYISPEELAKNPEISKITTNKKIIKFAQESRKYFDRVFKRQNDFRKLRNQPEILYRKYYSPHELQKKSLWGETFGLKKEPRDLFYKPELPDYIKPDKPFNPRAMAREAGLPKYKKQMNLKELLENYTNTAARDIFNTSIVQNNKAFAQQLESMGYLHSSRLIQDWTAEAYSGVKAVADRAAALGPTMTRGMRWWRQALIKGVFPLNVAWNAFVQTSSGVLTGMRYGIKNTIAGTFDWFTRPSIRKWIKDNAYSYITKTGKAGKVTRQDVSRGMARAAKIQKSKFENATDAANYFTEWVEKHLTGISVAAARRRGKSVGLKGKSLLEFASDGGAKTQSMYNLEDLPGILRSEVIKTGAPFNTFRFEMFNTLREFAGKTGVPPSTFRERMGWLLRFLGGAYAVNSIGAASTGRKPWELSSFIPFYSLIFAPVESKLKGKPIAGISTRNLPAPIGIGAEFAEGTHKFIESGDFSKLRTTAIRYLPGLAGIPGGTQASRIVDGIIAISDGGMKDSGGSMLFPIHDAKDKIRAIFSGPWSTSGGQQYWEEREDDWLDIFDRFRGEPETSYPSLPSLKRP